MDDSWNSQTTSVAGILKINLLPKCLSFFRNESWLSIVLASLLATFLTLKEWQT